MFNLTEVLEGLFNGNGEFRILQIPQTHGILIACCVTNYGSYDMETDPWIPLPPPPPPKKKK